MKKIVGIVAFFFCITYFTISCYAQSNEFPCAGIVTASKLICRTEPFAGSTAITSFNFSNPIVLINKSKTKVRINNIEEYWYQEQTTKG